MGTKTSTKTGFDRHLLTFSQEESYQDEKLLSPIILHRLCDACLSSLFQYHGRLACSCFFASSVILSFISRGKTSFKPYFYAALLSGLAILVAGAGTIGMMRQVQSNCGHLDPRSDAGVSCFGDNYSADRGLHDVIEKSSHNDR